MDFVAIDIGASNTRYLSIDSKINFLSNKMSFAGMDDQLDNEWIDEKLENNLDVSVYKDGDSAYFPARALIGGMASRFMTSFERPISDIPKSSQKVNYMSIITSIALSKLNNSAIGDTVNLFVALPPDEVRSADTRAEFIDNIIGNYTVKFNKYGSEATTVQFKINNVKCVEESRLALLQFLFDEDYPERLQKFGGCDILSIDIGASTTDLVIFKQGKFYNNTGKTCYIGCNSAVELIRARVKSKYKVNLTPEGAEQCIMTGRIKSGNTYIEATDVVDLAKKDIAGRLKEEMDTYFTVIGTPLDSLNYIIVSGGGSMESSYIDDNGSKKQTSAPMSKYITEALKEKCENVDIIHYGDEPRLANIYGLAKIALLSDGEIKK